MTEPIDDECPVCPICNTETHGRKCASSYCEGYQDAKNEAKEPCATCWEAGYEAGRLAAIRADVALFVRQTNEVAIDAQERAAVLSNQARIFYATRHLKRPPEAREPSIPTMQRIHVLDYRFARICVDQAADCGRWIQETA